MLHHYLTGDPEPPKGPGSKATLEQEEREAAARWRKKMVDDGWTFAPAGLKPSTGSWKKVEGTAMGGGVGWADGDLMVERRTGNVNPNARWRAIVGELHVGTARSKESAQQVAREYAGAPLEDRRPMLADLSRPPSRAELFGGSPEMLTEGRYEEVVAKLRQLHDEYAERDERRNYLVAAMMGASQARQAAAANQGRRSPPILPEGTNRPWPWKKEPEPEPEQEQMFDWRAPLEGAPAPAEQEERRSVLGWLKSLYGNAPSYEGAAAAKGRPVPKDVWDDARTVRIAEAAGGSNGARFAEAPDGTKWLVKAYRGDQDRVANELLANAVYRKLGVRVPDAGTLSFEGRAALAYPLLDGERRPWTDPSPELAEGFMADALLANWDVVGLEMDNVLWDAHGVPFRVDQGGTFEYRAQGSPKEFGPVPTEVWTMAGPRGQAFGTMALTPEVKREGAAMIGELLDDQTIDQLADAAPFKDEAMRERVRENLKARVEWMRRYARGEVAEPKLPEGRSARSRLKRWQAGLTPLPEQEVALEGFAAHPGVVNDELRKEGRPPDPVRFVARHLDSLLRRSRVEEDIAVYLAVGEGWQHLPGRRVRERGFLTATFSFDEAASQAGPKGAVVRLLVPPGVGAVSLRDLVDDGPKEPAVILERGLPYRVAAVSRRGDVPVLEAAVV